MQCRQESTGVDSKCRLLGVQFDRRGESQHCMMDAAEVAHAAEDCNVSAVLPRKVHCQRTSSCLTGRTITQTCAARP